MRYIFSVVKGNVRKNKGVYVGIFVLMFIVSLALCSILTYTQNAQSRVEDGVDESGFGDMFAALKEEEMLAEYGITYDKIVSNVQACDCVERVETIDTISSLVRDCNGYTSSNSMFLISKNNGVLNYNIYDDRQNKIDITLNKGEVCVPVCFTSLYDCKIGDTITLGNEEYTKSYKVVAFMEDPFMGCSVMGIKTILFSDEDIEDLK